MIWKFEDLKMKHGTVLIIPNVFFIFKLSNRHIFKSTHLQIACGKIVVTF
jgi:hypothetical protein